MSSVLNGLALAHPAEFYNLLFRAARETLLEAATANCWPICWSPMANCHRKEKLALIRQLLEVPPAATGSVVADMTQTQQSACCPHCGQAALYTVRRTPRPTVPDLIAGTYAPRPFDTS